LVVVENRQGNLYPWRFYSTTKECWYRNNVYWRIFNICTGTFMDHQCERPI